MRVHFLRADEAATDGRECGAAKAIKMEAGANITIRPAAESC
jgi:hypothetical protein